MGNIVGIDLGTTNSLVAVVDSGIPYVIADPEGNRLTPSVVHVPGPDQSPLVGHSANRVRVIRPRDTVYSVKRFMGRRGAEIPREDMLVTYPVKGEGAGPVTIELAGRAWTPEEVSAEVLKKLKRDAEASLGVAVDRAVITVPAYFNDAQRNATIRAGELAGLKVERIVNEPTAAALAYGLDKLGDRSRIAVYDLGGGTFDLSILELNQGTFQVLSTHGDTRLGGDDFDRRLTDHLLSEIRKAGGPEGAGDLSILSRVREEAERAKIRLSTETEVEIALPFLRPDFSFSCRVDRETLERLTKDLVDRTRAHCLRALSDAKLEAKDLNQVILVGGQTRMPLVRRKVSEWFGCAEFAETRGDVRLGEEYHQKPGPELNTSVNPDEAVALGAAIQAEILSGGFRSGSILSTGVSQPASLELNTSTGTLLAAEPWADIQRVTYSLKPSTDGTGGQDLYRGVCRNLLASSTPDIEDQLLLRNVRRLDIQSYDGLASYPIWDTTDKSSVRTNLPVAVRVRVYRETDDESAPAELLVPIGTQSRTNSTTTVGG